MPASRNKRKKKKQPVKASVNKTIDRKLKRLKELCKLAECDVYSKLTQKDKVAACIFGTTLNRLQKGPGADIDTSLLSFLSKVLNGTFRQKKYRLHEEWTQKISIYDVSIVLGLIDFIDRGLVGVNGTYNNMELKQYLEPLKHHFKDEANHIYMILDVLLTLMEFLNTPTDTMYYFRMSKDRKHELRIDQSVVYNFTIFTVVANKEWIKIGGNKRPIYQLGWPRIDSGIIDYVQIETDKLGSLYNGKKQELAVYIQKHAYNRMVQRNSPCPENWTCQEFQQSFTQRMEIQVFEGRILFTYSSSLMKIGYFLADIVEEKIVIRTFLLITHANTPEGAKFQELTNFCKEDVNYWSIDKLTFFINNEMEPDNELYPYFKEAGLLKLFELKQEYFEVVKHEYSQVGINWDSILDYINRHNTEEVYEELDGMLY